MVKKVTIIGGGIIGLSTAYFLTKQGHQVTVVEKGNFSSGASYVNAGYITPSHIIPLASPGMITKGIKWMFNSESPFYVKPRLNSDFLKWSWAFKKSCTKSHVAKCIPVIKDINILSRELYQELKNTNEFDFHFEKKGLLMCYQTDKVGEEEWNVGKKAIEQGLQVENLNKQEVKKIEPNIDFNIKGAVFFHSDAHMTPQEFMKKMHTYLKKQGVLFFENEEVIDVNTTNKSVDSITTTKQEITTDELVLATGSWSFNLAKKLGVNIPLQAGKGYRIDVKEPTGISVPAILCEAKVAVTPMQGFTRFAGTMEIAGINHTINKKRVNAIAKAAENYYNGLKIDTKFKNNANCGLRPCSPDGMPYIGRTQKFTNLTIATGHAMMGWSLGPATGKLVSEIINNQKTSINLTMFSPDRGF